MYVYLYCNFVLFFFLFEIVYKIVLGNKVDSDSDSEKSIKYNEQQNAEHKENKSSLFGVSLTSALITPQLSVQSSSDFTEKCVETNLQLKKQL